MEYWETTRGKNDVDGIEGRLAHLYTHAIEGTSLLVPKYLLGQSVLNITTKGEITLNELHSRQLVVVDTINLDTHLKKGWVSREKRNGL